MKYVCGGCELPYLSHHAGPDAAVCPQCNPYRTRGNVSICEAHAAVLDFDPCAHIQRRGRNIAVVSPRLGYALAMTGRIWGEENAWRVAKSTIDCLHVTEKNPEKS